MLCRKLKYQEAYDLLLNELKFDELKDRFEFRQYYYYKGITSLLAKDNFADAHLILTLLYLLVNKENLIYLMSFQQMV